MVHQPLDLPGKRLEFVRVTNARIIKMWKS